MVWKFFVRLGNCKKIKSVNAEDDKIFILKNIFNKLNIHQESVLINFCRFDDIDEMKLDDLNKYFYDIWYPVVEDIEIFDRECNWMILISHDGDVGYISF